MPLSLIVLAVLVVFVFAFEWRLLRTLLTQDPEWKREIRATPRRERRRIAREVRNGRQLDEPRDARLAVGMAEMRLALNRSMDRRTRWLRIVLGIGLMVLGALAGAITVILLGAIFTVLGLTTRLLGERQRRRLKRSVELNRAQAAIEAHQPGQ